MGHNVGKVAEMAVNSSQQKLLAAETPEQIFKFLRANTIPDQPNLSIPPDKVRFLLERYDAAVIEGAAALLQLSNAQAQIATQNEQLEQFRAVYEQENSSRGTVTLVAETVPASDPHPYDIHRFDDDGGTNHPEA